MTHAWAWVAAAAAAAAGRRGWSWWRERSLRHRGMLQHTVLHALVQDHPSTALRLSARLHMPVGRLYRVLRDLEGLELVSSYDGPAVPERGGRPHRYYVPAWKSAPAPRQRPGAWPDPTKRGPTNGTLQQ